MTAGRHVVAAFGKNTEEFAGAVAGEFAGAQYSPQDSQEYWYPAEGAQGDS